MKKLLPLGVMVLAALTTPALAGEMKHGTYGGRPTLEATEQYAVQVTVVAIDKNKRLLTLVGEDGDTTVVKAGPEVKNFAQIHLKDLVKVAYTERLKIWVEPSGAPEETQESTTAAAQPGEKPKGAATERMLLKASITAIDKQAKTATLKRYDGTEFTVTPQNPATLDKVKVGELVVFDYSVGVAASVEKVAAKK